MRKLHLFCLPVLSMLGTQLGSAQIVQPGRNHLDSILEKKAFTPGEINAMDLGGGAAGAKDGKVDVRDLVIFFNNLRNNGDPAEASFETGESLAFVSQNSVTLPIIFSKPVTGTIRFDLGGNAENGLNADYTLAQTEISLTNATRTQLTVNIRPWRGMGGEKALRLTLRRQPQVIPANGAFSTHLLRLRQFEQGEFVGMLTFPPESTLPSLPVRLGLAQGGSGYCSFETQGTILGGGFAFMWQAGASGFPNVSGAIPLSLPGAIFGRGAQESVSASLAFQRLTAPFPADLQEYLAGFPANDQPATYRATFTFQNLFAAGDAAPPAGPNPFAVVFQGRLTLQPVRYAPIAP
jgi:hypothetical protein